MEKATPKIWDQKRLEVTSIRQHRNAIIHQGRIKLEENIVKLICLETVAWEGAHGSTAFSFKLEENIVKLIRWSNIFIIKILGHVKVCRLLKKKD